MKEVTVVRVQPSVDKQGQSHLHSGRSGSKPRRSALSNRFNRSLFGAFLFLAVLSFLLLLQTIRLLHRHHLVLLVPELQPAAQSTDRSGVAGWPGSARNDWRVWGQKCVHPHLSHNNPAVMQFYRKAAAVQCSSAKDWVYVTNGTFRISPQARLLHGKIECMSIQLVREGDFRVRDGRRIDRMEDGRAVPWDFFRVFCTSSDGRRYFSIHSAVAWNPAVWARLDKYHASGTADSTGIHASGTADSTGIHSQHPHSTSSQQTASFFQHDQRLQNQNQIPTYNSLNLSVFMFGFDSLSRMAWIRLLPKTRDYYLRVLDGIEMLGYNIIGDGTPAALLPILTGKMEEELPEARRGFSGAKSVDNHPWVWKNFSQQGYITAYAEDMASVGTFQYRMLGFKKTPTDHYMRPFYLAAEKLYNYNKPFCLGSRPRHVNFMNWFRDLFDMYKHVQKFFFGFHSELSHDDFNLVQALDDDFLAFLQYLEERGHLNSTLLILMADHGARNADMRKTVQGSLEERMPYFSFRFPPWFRKAYPEIVRNMELNSERLTSPFDIHETVLEVLNFTGAEKGNVQQRGISLFKEVPKERTCSHAGILPHWCACLGWNEVSRTDDVVMQAAQSALREINSLTANVRYQCSNLMLLRITHSAHYVPNTADLSLEQKVYQYANSKRQNTSETPHSPSPAVELYQVSFQTLPGYGHFEVTCSLNVNSSSFSVNTKEISRINKYGTQPACIQDKLPHLRPYCFCSDHH